MIDLKQQQKSKPFILVVLNNVHINKYMIIFSTTTTTTKETLK